MPCYKAQAFQSRSKPIILNCATTMHITEHLSKSAVVDGSNARVKLPLLLLLLLLTLVMPLMVWC